MKKIFFSLLVLLTFGAVSAQAAKIVTIDQLKDNIDDKSWVVLDVRTGSDWTSSKFKIKGAARASSKEFGIWSEQYPKDTKLILYCA